LTLHFHISWLHNQSSGIVNEQENVASSIHGFASISRRHTSCKPMIAAVNGSAYGGGVEMILNCDMVIASEDAVFALPEVKRGVLAAQGGE
jgi:enoyl-CoA hydratase/carnithine racemase